jgi:hypothetical protein
MAHIEIFEECCNNVENALEKRGPVAAIGIERRYSMGTCNLCSVHHTDSYKTLVELGVQTRFECTFGSLHGYKHYTAYV